MMGLSRFVKSKSTEGPCPEGLSLKDCGIGGVSLMVRLQSRSIQIEHGDLRTRRGIGIEVARGKLDARQIVLQVKGLLNHFLFESMHPHQPGRESGRRQ